MPPVARSSVQASTTILVVDDSRSIAMAVAGILNDGGYRSVHTLTDPRETTAQCRRLNPEILILDYEMPHMNGLAVIDALASAGLENMPAVIMLTGKSDHALMLAALEHGARDFVNKPCDRSELLARVGNVAQVQALQRQLRQQNLLLEGMVTERTERLQQATEVLRQAERRLTMALARSEAENRDKTLLLANAAHELRTPLNAVIGFAELLKNQIYGPVGDPRYQEFASDIHQAGLHLLSLVDDTLDLAKAESGKQVLNFEQTDVGAVVQSSMRLLKTLADSSGVKLKLEAPDEPLLIRTDPEKVRQVVLNLASNAIKFTPRNGQVTVEVKPDPVGGALIMIVRDTGVGMAPHEVSQAMKPFGQVRTAVSTSQKGTGLGLPLTKRFVEMLGGTLSIDSEPGRGTVVVVNLPADAGGLQSESRRAAM